MGLFSKLKGKAADTSGRYQESPPEWAPATEQSHAFGLLNEAPEEECDAAIKFCENTAPFPPRLLPSLAVDDVANLGCKAWQIEVPTSPRFIGHITNPRSSEEKSSSTYSVCRVDTDEKCKSVCLLSNLPMLAGLYDIQGKEGVYYETCIKQMDGIVALGLACRPYPEWRLPGWNRLSAGLHLDDLRKFFEDSDGGRDYLTDGLLQPIRPGDFIGCGYSFANGTIFFTYNGVRLPPAFSGSFYPRQNYDVFAAIGVEGVTDVEVNFGAELFRWKEGNDWAWRVEGHVGRMAGGSGGWDEELPSYGDSVRR